jgi:transposase
MGSGGWGWIVPDGLWDVVEPLLPALRVRPQGGGTANLDDEAVFAAIVYVLTTGCAWRHLPPCFGLSKSTVHRRFTLWTRDGLWGRLRRAMLEHLVAADVLDVSRVVVDSVHVRAKKVPLWFSSSSGRGGRGLVEGAVAEHGEEDVDAAAGECDEGGDVVFAFASFPVVVGA